MTLTVKVNRTVRCATKVSAIVDLVIIIIPVKQGMEQSNYLIGDVQSKKTKHFIAKIATVLKTKFAFMEDVQLEVRKLVDFKKLFDRNIFGY